MPMYGKGEEMRVGSRNPIRGKSRRREIYVAPMYMDFKGVAIAEYAVVSMKYCLQVVDTDAGTSTFHGTQIEMKM